MTNKAHGTGVVPINPNIQMLRGVAVLLVLAFHLQLEWFAWGYLGVDLFFVVSGFLMPLILPKYSPLGFLAARIRRIYPALLAAIAACFLIGWFVMMPGEMDGLSQSALAALGSVSEFWFAHNTGYFDEPQQSHPLLHTWSLGVEFLCYALVAGLLWLVPGEARRAQAALGLAAVCGIAFAALWLWRDGQVNYFNPLPRMALFFAAFWVSARGWRLSLPWALGMTLAGAGTLAVVFGSGVMARDFPGPAALLLLPIGLPVMMLAGPLPLPRFIAAPLGWLGDISYSLYIWHWPIITLQMLAFRNFQIRPYEALILAGLSLLAAVISYYLIERSALLRRMPVLAGGAAVLAAVCLAGMASGGFAGRIPAELQGYASIAAMRSTTTTACERDFAGIGFTMPCDLADGGRDTVVVIGDSHSRHFMPVLLAGEPETRVMRLRRDPGDLADEMDAITAALREAGASRVYLAYRWYDEDAAGVSRLLDRLEQGDMPEAVPVRDIPAYRFNPVACWLRQNSTLLGGSCEFDPRQPAPLARVENAAGGAWRQVAGTSLPVIDSHALLCTDGSCPLLHDGVLLYRDNNHLHERLPIETQLWLYQTLFAADRAGRADNER